MANYNAGDMIRLTRQSLGISQEELSDTICSVQTLSRIENGKVSVKRKIYRQLMERMGRNGEKSYCTLTVEDFDMLDYKVKADTAIYRKYYEEAEECLNKLKPFLDLEDNIVNIQVYRRRECIINYQLKRITKEEFLRQLEELIGLTVKDYEKLLDKVYPFMNEEVQLLMNIASAYSYSGNFEKAIRIDYMLIRSLNKGYMGPKDSIQLKVMLICCIAKYYGELGEHQRAIEMSRNAIHKAKSNHLITILPNAYGEIAWNMMQQIENGSRDKNDLYLCKRYLRQGYAAAAMAKQNTNKNITKKYYEECFGETIY